jgi:transposase, IS30 family
MALQTTLTPQDRLPDDRQTCRADHQGYQPLPGGVIELRPRDLRAITSDNGCEFHGYEDVELSNGTLIYCAQPLHSWERGSNENASGLIRQYLPKGICMAHLTQSECDRIAEKLNLRPRKRYNYRTPKELFI